MYHPEFSIYLGREDAQGFSGFIAEEDLFVVVKIPTSFSREQGIHFLDSVKKRIAQKDIHTRSSFELAITEVVRRSNLPEDFSLAALLMNDDTVFLKTFGMGEIFLHRKQSLAHIIKGDTVASGPVHIHDLFILTTEHFSQTIGGLHTLQSIFSHGETVVNSIQEHIRGKDDTGLIALIVSFTQKVANQAAVLPEIQVSEPPNKEPSPFFPFLKKNEVRSGPPLPKKKILTTISVIIILLLFVWSVVLGYQRRTNAETEKKVYEAKQIIVYKLNQSQEVESLNFPRALALLQDSKDTLNTLKKEVKRDNKGLQELEALVSERENSILKRGEKSYQEFYDLAIENQHVKADMWYQSADSVAIVDKNNNSVYILSLTKKSVSKRTSTDIHAATLVGLDANTVFLFIPGKGMYSIDADNKQKKVIDNDPDWGRITALGIYSGNIYFLDTGKDTIYKYLVSTDGYSNKLSYFSTGKSLSIQNAQSMGINGSIYITLSGSLLKFTSGLQDGFSTTYPDSDVHIAKVITPEDSDHVYTWDKQKGVVYELSKEGTYQRQTKSSIFKTATDIAVVDSTIYSIQGSKVYSVDE